MPKFKVGDKLVSRQALGHRINVTAVGETRYLVKGLVTGLEYGTDIETVDEDYELTPDFFEEGKTYRDPESYNVTLNKDALFEAVANYVDPDGNRVSFGWWHSALFGNVKATVMDQSDFDNFEEIR